jgi:hypothetical protein
MRPSNDLPAVYLCRDVVDFRKGINGLAVLVEATLQLLLGHTKLESTVRYLRIEGDDALKISEQVEL